MSNRAEEVVRQALFAVVRQHGSAIYSDARRFEALLKDLGGPHPREIRILVEAVREGIPVQLVAAMKSGEPIVMAISRMVQHLDDLGNKPEIARWSIETWLAALKTGARTSSFFNRGADSQEHKISPARDLLAVEDNTPLCQAATVGQLGGSVLIPRMKLYTESQRLNSYITAFVLRDCTGEPLRVDVQACGSAFQYLIITATHTGQWRTAKRPLVVQWDSVHKDAGWKAIDIEITEFPPKAVKWYRLATEERNAEAQFKIGSMYDDGRGVLQNDIEAVKWYRLAAEQGLAKAQFELGLMYFNGTGVPQNDLEAIKWYRLAAEQGLVKAQSNLGWMYANGRGVPQNCLEAVKWYRLAAEQGDAWAQDILKWM